MDDAKVNLIHHRLAAFLRQKHNLDNLSDEEVLSRYEFSIQDISFEDDDVQEVVAKVRPKYQPLEKIKLTFGNVEFNIENILRWYE